MWIRVETPTGETLTEPVLGMSLFKHDGQQITVTHRVCRDRARLNHRGKVTVTYRYGFEPDVTREMELVDHTEEGLLIFNE
jgi:hypothetical protein